MSYRTFLDSNGTEWHVWEIVPRLSERRLGDRRSSEAPIPIPERRRHAERRLAESRRSVLRGSYSRGWLCFESETEKRRLMPIPRDWSRASSQTLERCAQRAELVSPSGRELSA